jgi:acetyltransferase-like isoleucine patch superfamily enzyme
VNNLFETPWKLTNELKRCLLLPVARLTFASNQIAWGDDWKIFGLPILQKHRRSEMNFGSGLSLRSFVQSNPLGPNHPVILCTWQTGAVLDVGDNFGMTGGSLCAAESIMIGNRVIVGANTVIVDTDFHPLDHHIRNIHPQDSKTAPVHIQDDVFIGMNCLILKGVTIGKGSVIGAGSVVVNNIPAGVVAAGNPAVVIKSM